MNSKCMIYDSHFIGLSKKIANKFIFTRLVSKYHPKCIASQDEAQKTNLQSRLKAFVFLLESGKLEGVPVSTDYMDDIVRTMDAGK